MKMIFAALVMTMVSASAFAQEVYATREELPAGSVIEALISRDGKPVCPKGETALKKYCWSKSKHWFVHCGWYCNPNPEPGQHH